jgi:hypothetical protein
MAGRKKCIDATPTRVSARQQGKKQKPTLPSIVETNADVGTTACTATTTVAAVTAVNTNVSSAGSTTPVVVTSTSTTLAAATTTANTTGTTDTTLHPLSPPALKLASKYNESPSSEVHNILASKYNKSPSSEAYDIATGFRLYKKIITGTTTDHTPPSDAFGTRDDDGGGDYSGGNNDKDDDLDDKSGGSNFDLDSDEVEYLDEGVQPIRPEPASAILPIDDIDDPPSPMPDVTGLSEAAAKRTLSCWNVEMKKYRDRKAREQKDAHNRILGRDGDGDDSPFTGEDSAGLRLMEMVEGRRLMVGDSFQDRDVLRMRVAEEANLRQIGIVIKRSDKRSFEVVGDDFYVKANNGKRKGWVVTAAFVRAGDGPLPVNKATTGWHGNLKTEGLEPCHYEEECSKDASFGGAPCKDVIRPLLEGSADSDVEHDDKDNNNTDDEDYSDDELEIEDAVPTARTPYVAEWLVPIIKSTIAVTPRASNKFLLGVLGPYGNKYAFTKAIIQKARDLARAEIFGDPGNNVRYILGLQHKMRQLGHECKVIFSNRKETLNKLKLVVLSEAVRNELDENRKMELATKDSAKAFLKHWTRANDSFITRYLGTKNDKRRFVQGIAFATSTSKRTAPNLQEVIQADAAHMNFGKYTLYSAYGTTANAQSSPIAFAILFGNEDKSSWITFWKFALSVHPWLADGVGRGITIVTDQDKGSRAAIEEVLPGCFNFFCSFHRRQNIMKKCKGGVNHYKGAWLFNKLLNAKTPEAIGRIREACRGRMAPRDVAYLASIPDAEQYPAARCAMARHVVMYGRSSSASVESMNAANKEIWARTSVCLVNATILLLKLECERYTTMKEMAWNNEGQLTPRGSLLAEDAGKEVPYPCEYKWTVIEHPTYHEYSIKGNHGALSLTQNLRIVKVSMPGDYGSRPSSCTCGVPQVDGVPCRHAIAVAKSPAQRTNYSVLNAMPRWWTAEAWRRQFPSDDKFLCNFDLQSIKETCQPDDSIYYCPDFAGPRKKGRPKKNTRAKSPLEIALSQHNGTGGKKRRVRMRDEELEHQMMEPGDGGGAVVLMVLGPVD